MDRLGANTTVPVGERTPDAGRSADAPAPNCTDCPPLKRYDSTEVIKTSRDVDQSRVINTEDVVQVRPRVREINKLVIHENETRNVGVIQHNHRIVEKETRYENARRSISAPSRHTGFRVSRPCSCPSWCSPCRIAAVPARAPDRTAPTPRLTFTAPVMPTIATLATLGTAALSSSSHFPAIVGSELVKPVMLPSGGRCLLQGHWRLHHHLG